jgi:hypothetical protein
MPAESIRAAHSVLTEISAHPVSKSSLAERLHHPTPTQKRPCAGLRGIFSRNWWPQCPLRVTSRHPLARSITFSVYRRRARAAISLLS